MIRYIIEVLLSRFANRLNVECEREGSKGPLVDGLSVLVGGNQIWGSERWKTNLCLSHFKFEALPRRPRGDAKETLDMQVRT